MGRSRKGRDSKGSVGEGRKRPKASGNSRLPATTSSNYGGVARTGTKKNRVWKVRKGTIPLFMVGNRIMRQVLNMETLKMSLETQGRSGRKVTVVKGFTRRSEELEELAGRIKKACGTGGTVKGMSLEIQGDAREKVRSLLLRWGFQVRG